MTPWLLTPGATKAARPACAMVIVPWLTTAALALPGWLRLRLPPLTKVLMSLRVGEDVVATRPATSTCALGPNQMPLGLARTMRPFELNEPKIWDGLLPVTFSSCVDVEFGCVTLTP